MKLQFKNQQFQADAAQSVVNVFAGQPYSMEKYLIDSGIVKSKQTEFLTEEHLGAANSKIILTDEKIFDNLQKVQRKNNLVPSERLEKIDGGYNLTIEMETGVGKTYTYIKTMYELNKNFGWSKFIIIVPSIAIREGVYKTFQVTEDHFAEEYGKKIKFFIYNSARLTEIEHFAEDNEINAMIINSQAFNAKGKDARRIKMALDEFRSRRPIDVIAKTNPILIIDEPQSVEGAKTKESLREFQPLLTLRYSATHREFYNLIYRLDAVDAYNKKLVKEINVTGIKASGTTAASGYVFFEKVNVYPNKQPEAVIHFDCKTKSGIRKKIKAVTPGFNIYENSGELDEYKNNFVVRTIDGRDNSLEFLNGTKIFVGDSLGRVDEEQLRKIQIRETIKAHLQKEAQLYKDGIKVLSLFFIDEVAHYKIYDETGKAGNGDFANWFEEIYLEEVEKFINETSLPIFPDINVEYKNYLSQIPVGKTHAGYFSIDKKGKIENSKITNRSEKTSDDIDAYNLIMKNKELLLDLDAKKSPVRFIFSHSALREGWDNPNVFQICTLKQSGSDIRKRQEVGRGLRLCVNQEGIRQDENILGAKKVHEVNALTVIAGESYEEFSKKLQSEIAESVSYRPRAVTQDLFVGKIIKDTQGNEKKIASELAESIIYELTVNRYIDKKGFLTDKYSEDKKNSALEFVEEVADCKESLIEILDGVYTGYKIKNTRDNNVKPTLKEDKKAMSEFQTLWDKINVRTIYHVDFNSDKFIDKIVSELNQKLHINKIYFQLESGRLEEIKSKEDLEAGTAFKKSSTNIIDEKEITAVKTFEFDIVNKLVAETGLTRQTIVKILCNMNKEVFSQFKSNPEEFAFNASNIINSQKAVTVIQCTTYKPTDQKYNDKEVFPETLSEGKLNSNAFSTEKNLYNYLITDSKIEKDFADELEASKEVIVYVKLPKKFSISTPMGSYNPDWAIVFNKDNEKNIYFVAETKGSMDETQLRLVEHSKIECARKHFQAISKENLRYDVVTSYKDLLDKIMK